MDPFADQPPTAAEEFQRLQGTWQVQLWEEGGESVADIQTRGVFFGGNTFILRRDDMPFQSGVVQLDPGKAPATMNLSVREGEGKDGVMLGVYSLEGDTLLLCFDPEGQSRPRNFKPDAKDGFTRITAKKPAPLADETIDIIGKYRSEIVDAMTGSAAFDEVIVEKRGDSYVLTYRHSERVLFLGTALRRGNWLSMCWASGSQAGVSVYKIEPGPRLVGEYTILGSVGVIGKEVLVPWGQID